ALGLTRALSGQLQASRALPVTRRARPVTIALCALQDSVPLLELADQLSRALCAFGKVAVLHPGPAGETALGTGSRPEALARFGPVVERCELDHDPVILVCAEGAQEAGPWEDFCLARADRVLAVADGTCSGPRSLDPAHSYRPGQDERIARLHGCDLVGYGV